MAKLIMLATCLLPCVPKLYNFFYLWGGKH
jgi:hypothetical protein